MMAVPGGRGAPGPAAPRRLPCGCSRGRPKERLCWLPPPASFVLEQDDPPERERMTRAPAAQPRSKGRGAGWIQRRSGRRGRWLRRRGRRRGRPDVCLIRQGKPGFGVADNAGPSRRCRRPTAAAGYAGEPLRARIQGSCATGRRGSCASWSRGGATFRGRGRWYLSPASVGEDGGGRGGL